MINKFGEEPDFLSLTPARSTQQTRSPTSTIDTTVSIDWWCLAGGQEIPSFYQESARPSAGQPVGGGSTARLDHRKAISRERAGSSRGSVS